MHCGSAVALLQPQRRCYRDRIAPLGTSQWHSGNPHPSTPHWHHRSPRLGTPHWHHRNPRPGTPHWHHGNPRPGTPIGTTAIRIRAHPLAPLQSASPEHCKKPCSSGASRVGGHRGGPGKTSQTKGDTVHQAQGFRSAGEPARGCTVTPFSPALKLTVGRAVSDRKALLPPFPIVALAEAVGAAS
jgi:hypothetical protein